MTGLKRRNDALCTAKVVKGVQCLLVCCAYILSPAKKAVVKKAPAKKVVAKKAPAKKAAPRKAAPKKPAAKKPAAS